MNSYEDWQVFVGVWGTIYFILLAFAALIYALWPSNKKKFDDAAQIPFSED